MLDKNGFARRDGFVFVENYSLDDGRWLSSEEMWLSKGQGLPSGSTTVQKLENKEGCAQVFDGKKWKYVEDNRGKTAYDVITKEEIKITYIGNLKDEHTLLEPPSLDHEFIDGKWIITGEKKKELEKIERERKEQERQAQIADLKSQMNMHLLLDEKDQAREIALKIRELEG